jgi:hypothetical protein
MQHPSDKNIVWLVSYPKSGNTWFRIFLSNLLGDMKEPVDINKLLKTPIASSRTVFDVIAGLPSSDLTHEEIDNIRPQIYRQLSHDTKEIMYHKVHDMYHYNQNGEPIFPEDVTRKIIYLVRNPFDVSVSFAHHMNTTIDKAIEMMNNPGACFCKKTDRLHNQLRQKLGTWSQHVSSWLNLNGYDIHLIKYEDLVQQSVKTFTTAARFLELDKSDAQIEKAVEFSKIEVLQQQEEEKGFREKPAKMESFFRKGTISDWKNALNKKQFDEILKKHGEIIDQFSYL